MVPLYSQGNLGRHQGKTTGTFEIFDTKMDAETPFEARGGELISLVYLLCLVRLVYLV
jgi:hypothetical protein